jgi:hypothetical protein
MAATVSERISLKDDTSIDAIIQKLDPRVAERARTVAGQFAETIVESILLVLTGYKCLVETNTPLISEVLQIFETWEDELLHHCMKTRRQVQLIMSDFKFNLGSSKIGNPLYSKLSKQTDSLRQNNHSQAIVGNPMALRSFLADLGKLIHPGHKILQEKIRDDNQLRSSITSEISCISNTTMQSGFENLRPKVPLQDLSNETDFSSTTNKTPVVPSLNLSQVASSNQPRVSKYAPGPANKENEGKRNIVRNYAANKKSISSNEDSNGSKDKSNSVSNKMELSSRSAEKKVDEVAKDIQICEFKPESFLDVTHSNNISAHHERTDTVDNTLYKIGLSDRKANSQLEVPVTVETSTPPLLIRSINQTKDHSACSPSKNFISNNAQATQDVTAVFQLASDANFTSESCEHNKTLRNFMTFSNLHYQTQADFGTKKSEIAYDSFNPVNIASRMSEISANRANEVKPPTVYYGSMSHQSYSANAASLTQFNFETKQDDTANFCFYSGAQLSESGSLPRFATEQAASQSRPLSSFTTGTRNTPTRVDCQSSHVQPRSPARQVQACLDGELTLTVDKSMTFEANKFLANRKAEKLHVNLGRGG